MNRSNSTYYSTGIQQMLINGEQMVNFANMNENKTLYANPYMVVNDREYTKHYYTEGQRIASKIGGGLTPSIVHYDQKITPITEDTYAVLSDRLLKRCQLSNDCVGFNGEYSIYPQTIKCIKNLADLDDEEKDRYFYHSDHIGSSSFITDRNGYASQHLQYLPFGELFVEQRSTANYYTPYKFSGKEKDEETSYSYFGARYYMSDVSVWLSVDPLRDKFPNISPYAYCNLSPIRYIDPDGLAALPVSKNPKPITQKIFEKIFDLYDHDGQKIVKENKQLTYLSGQNTCAIRMSYAFNLAGYKIPSSSQVAIDVRVQNTANGNFVLDAVSFKNFLEDTEKPTYQYKNITTAEDVTKVITDLHAWDDLEGIIVLTAGNVSEYGSSGHVDILYEDFMWDLSLYSSGKGTDLKTYLENHLSSNLSVYVWIKKSDTEP